MKTFTDLAVPFPLFEAPTGDASDYVGLASCRLCGGGGRHCLQLDIGCAVVVPCPSCGTENGLDARDRTGSPCTSCGSAVAFPEPLKAVKSLLICHACLRAGKGAITKDTELGMVSWEQAVKGVTHGVPGLRSGEFELVPIDPGEDWYGARVPKEHLFELLRTPTYHTWQGERWLFCCKQPMTYVGEWGTLLRAPGRSDDPRAFFATLVAPDEPSRDWLWEALDRGSGGVCLYAFRCRSCGRWRSNWDMD